MVKRKHNVLIADDNEADRFFLREIVQHHASQLEVVGEVGDGDEVIAYLWGYGEYADREKHPMPELLIMDVRMPRMTGIQVLEWMQTQTLPPLKVVMLADSSTELFRHRVADLGFKHFYSKVMETNELVDVVKRLQAELETGRVEAGAALT
jgi:DNA-binding NarL/FixJ family response regulator